LSGLTVFYHNLTSGFLSHTLHFIVRAFIHPLVLARAISAYFAAPLMYHLFVVSLSFSQLITREPICYFHTTDPPNHSHLSPLKCQLTRSLLFTAM